MQTQHRLDETGDTRSRLQMTQVRLHRTQHQRRRTIPLAEHLAQRIKLDRITQRRTRAMRLDVVDIRGLQPRRGQRLTQHRLLSRPTGHRLPTAGAVLVDRRTTHHRPHRIAVAQRVTEPLEHHHPGTLAAHIAVGSRVERLATPIRSQHPPPRTGDTVLRAQDQVHTRGQRLITLAAPQALTRQVQRHQRRRTRRVDHHRRAMHTKEIRQPARSEIRRIPERNVRDQYLPAAAAPQRSTNSHWWSNRRTPPSASPGSPAQ